MCNGCISLSGDGLDEFAAAMTDERILARLTPELQRAVRVMQASARQPVAPNPWSNASRITEPLRRSG